MAQILDGNKLAESVRERLRLEISKLNTQPGLATVLVGDDPASAVYVKMKGKACQKIGMHSQQITLPAKTREEELLQVVHQLNADPQIHGILVQLPLPEQIDEAKILLAIDPHKDVDGFHPHNMGLLLGNKGKLAENLLIPCTPKGCMLLIDQTGIDLASKHVVVVGRSNLVGKPVGLLSLYRNATVTLCHSRTQDLQAECLRADVLIAAVGKANLITADMVKPGAIVIDVGINRTDTGLVGDVDFASASLQASWITPVPGGVGPMTITCLLENTLIAMKNQQRSF